MRRIPEPEGRLESFDIVGPWSSLFATGNMVSNEQAPVGNKTYNAANKPVALPFRINNPRTAYKLGWLNSAVLTDNVDLGIYDAAWARKVSTGSVARSGSDALQWVDITDTPLPTGRYYLVFSTNGVTPSGVQGYANFDATYLAGMGCKDSATSAFPLPDPLTNMVDAATISFVPVVYIALRALT